MRKVRPVLIAALTVLILLVAWAALAHAAYAFDAVVTTCHDGDTCTLADGTRLRLHAIDAPELGQPYGSEARARINLLVAGHHVDVRPTGDRSYRRMVADLVLSDGRDVAAVMVTSGYAWVEPRWNGDPSQPARQLGAQLARRGLWAADYPVPPWAWRHKHSRPPER